jgi:hypothetical protein
MGKLFSSVKAKKQNKKAWFVPKLNTQFSLNTTATHLHQKVENCFDNIG